MWDDWQRYAEKYARAFVSQGFGPGDRVAVCASYGMNVGANTMTLAAHKVGFTVIPEGKCTFPVRVIQSYHPTAIVGSVFKLLRLARRMEAAGMDPKDSGITKLIVGGESFAEESRKYLDEVWGIPSYNTYGSTEGTMCGECTQRNGLHVPEDLVHLDIYDPKLSSFVPDGTSGRIVLTTLLPEGGKSGNLLINYDTDDVTEVITRETCPCGRTHMRIKNPRREAETILIRDIPINRVDIERGVFQRENMAYLSGEYEAFVYSDEDSGTVAMRVSLECHDPDTCDKNLVEEHFLSALFEQNPSLGRIYSDGTLEILFTFSPDGNLELYRLKGRPKRLVDRRN
jgi:coenzyme F390 synthetase